MKLREKFTAEEAEAAAEKARLEAEARKKIEEEEAQAEQARIAVIESQIAALEEKRNDLENSLAELRREKEGIENTLNNVSADKAEVTQLYKDFAPRLESEGIPDVSALVHSSEYAEADEIKKYKGTKTTARRKLAKVSEKKRALKAKVPKDPETEVNSSTTLEARTEEQIVGLSEEINTLAEQVAPSRQRQEEKIRKNTEACLALLRSEQSMPFVANTLNAIDSAPLIPGSVKNIAAYSKQFGEEALKRAIFEGLSPQIETMVNVEINSRGGTKEEARARIQEIVRTKIDRDILSGKMENFDQEHFAKSAEVEANKVEDKRQTARAMLPEVLQKELHYTSSGDEIVDIYPGTERTGRFPASSFRVEYEFGRESREMKALKQQKIEAEANVGVVKQLVDKKYATKVGFFGSKKKHEEELGALQKSYKEACKKAEDLDKDIEKQKRKDESARREISDLTNLIRQCNLEKEMGKRSHTTIRELFTHIKETLEQNQKAELDPTQKAIADEYTKMRKELGVIEERYKNLRR